jgi:hypothetical protein
MAKELYTVIAGDPRPPYIETGFLEKGSGQTRHQEGILSGKVVNRRGVCGIPNLSENWAVRKIDGKIPSNPVDVKDSAYRGEIEFLKWGDPRGTLIQTRYLKGYETLDLLYQNLVLNADSNINPDDANSAEVYFLELLSGENEFDEQQDKYKTLFIKNHAYNQDSISKSPSHISYMYKEKNEGQELKMVSKAIEDKGECILLVKNAASNRDSLRNLYGIVQGLTHNAEIHDDLLFDALMGLADSVPTEFMNKVKGHKQEVSDTFAKAKAYGLLDTTKDGVLVAGKDKKTILAEGIEAKGDSMVQWVYDHPVHPVAYRAAHQLKQITDKLK